MKKIIQNFGGRGEKLLRDNLKDHEKVLVKIKGTWGEGLVITDKRFYILKWGFMAGNTFGGRCMAFDLKNVTGLEIKKSLMTGTFEILTPATQNAQKSYWSSGSNSAAESDNVITFQRSDFTVFQEAANVGRDLIGNHGAHQIQENDELDRLKKLAELKKSGIITEEEFELKKKQILGI
jgi:hypothetical protein